MKIVSKAGTEFIVIEVFGDSEHLNPFSINAEHIRYIREHMDDKTHKPNGWALFMGSKMFTTTTDLGINECKHGDEITIGTTKFLCVEGSSLNGKDKGRYWVNFSKILYSRKFIESKDDKSNKIDSNNSEKMDKFAIMTIDERMIPISW